MGTGSDFLGGKAAGAKNGGAIPSFPHMSPWHSALLIKYRDNLTYIIFQNKRNSIRFLCERTAVETVTSLDSAVVSNSSQSLVNAVCAEEIDPGAENSCRPRQTQLMSGMNSFHITTYVDLDFNSFPNWPSKYFLKVIKCLIQNPVVMTPVY
jgi:hypothetical protein